MTVHTLWYAPIYGWVLLVSAWARRAAFLWAFLPPLAICFVEKIVFNTWHFAAWLQYRLSGPEEFTFGTGDMPMDPLSHLAPLQFLSTPVRPSDIAERALTFTILASQRSPEMIAMECKARALLRNLIPCALVLVFASVVHAQTQEALSVPADSPRWDLQGQAKAAEYQGRKCLYLNGGAAILKDFEMRDAVVDVDVSTPANRGFFGFQFRIANDGANAEWVYLRQHKSGLLDAMQYTPVLNTGANWQIYNGPGFTGAVDIPKDVWFHLRLEVAGAQAKLYVKDMDKPALVMNDLKSGIQKGQVALYVLTGATYFSNFEIRATPDAAWERHLPPMPDGTLTRWSLSPSYDALQRNLERALTSTESDAIHWQDVEAEPPGFVVIYRYREAPHLMVSFATDFSKRLEPQPGMKVIYARTNIDSDRDQVKKLYIGYSDDVSVFLNGKILFRGRSAQNFRDPGFLGIVNPENDAVYLPLKKGSNELMLAVSELGGGWGFICRLVDVGQ